MNRGPRTMRLPSTMIPLDSNLEPAPAHQDCVVHPLDVHLNWDKAQERPMPPSSTVAQTAERRARAHRLGFRVDAETKRQVERAAALERRSLTEFCLAALAEAARATFLRHESLVLSERDRAAFFDALAHPPKPNARLRRAFRSAEERVGA